MRHLVFLGGNGHCSARLDPVRVVLGGRFELLDVPYPGFEGRPRVDTFEAFLNAVQAAMIFPSAPAPLPQGARGEKTLIYATGIGGLFALALRARGAIGTTPILMQAPVLWGLERRWFPWFMRRGLWRLFPFVLRSRRFQQRFARTKFTRPPAPEMLAAFFAGYQQCEATTDFFHWLTPALLRTLERDLAARPEALERISFWWGDRDAVVSTEELRVTQRALGRTWPVRVLAGWGHYPMIDAPDEWVRSLSDELASAE